MSPQVKYFSLGGCGISAMKMLPTDRLMGSNEVTFGILLGGTVLFLPVKRLRVVTSNRHPKWL